jgi:hypothetical protein
MNTIKYGSEAWTWGYLTKTKIGSAEMRPVGTLTYEY